MDGSRAQTGVDVFDTYAPVIDYSTVRLLISLAFGNNWVMFHWDISVAFTNAKAEAKPSSEDFEFEDNFSATPTKTNVTEDEDDFFADL